MQSIIQRELESIEQREGVRILLAIESGSRAWGFASPDSDYDVRFIYVRPTEQYLRLDRTRNVIEMPINDLLDINGWDLSKMLQLLHGANPTLFEWFSSPIVYRTPAFKQDVAPLLRRYFSPRSCVHHYLNTACNHQQAYLNGDYVKAKKYFYVLRPLLACRWVLDKGTPPPILFDNLVHAQLLPAMKPYVDQLLHLKINEPELKQIRRIDPLHDYIDSSIAEIRNALSLLPAEPDATWDELNRFFLTELSL